MNEIALKECKKITRQLSEYDISSSFREDFDPIELKLEGYTKKIKRKMWFNYVIDKLEKAEYRTIESWKADISLIWGNAIKFYQPTHIIHEIARELKEQFEELTKNIPRNDFEKWVESLNKPYKKLSMLFKNPPSENYKPPPVNLRLKSDKPTIKFN